MTTDEAIQAAKDRGWSQADVFRMAKELYDANFIAKDDLPAITEMLGLPKEEPNPVVEWLKKDMT